MEKEPFTRSSPALKMFGWQQESSPVLSAIIRVSIAVAVAGAFVYLYSYFTQVADAQESEAALYDCFSRDIIIEREFATILISLLFSLIIALVSYMTSVPESYSVTSILGNSATSILESNELPAKH